MKVLVRADASRALGVGHVARCLTLAAVLRERGATVTFACRNLPGFDPAMVQGQGFALVLLPAEGDDLAQLQGQAFDWVLVDHYRLGAQWERAALSVGRRIAVIDDLADRPHQCDLLLDQNLTATQAAYEGKVNTGCERLLGPRYALLRPGFEPALAQLGKAQVQQVLVSFGGFDVANMALKTLQALTAWPTLKVTLLAGHDHPQWAALQALAARHTGWQVLSHSPRMAALMQAADLFIGAGGGTTWERAAVGVPSLCVAVADNQVLNAQALARDGAHLYLGEAATVTESSLQAAIGVLIDNACLRHSFAERARRYVDGQGAQRVATALLGPLLQLRRATAEDARLLYEGRNAKAARMASPDTRPLAWSAHQAWLHATLADTRRALLIAHFNSQPIGMLRYDRHPDEPGRAEVSLYLFEACLGQGWGRWLLRAGQRWLHDHWPDVVRLDAAVLPHNSASLRLFRTSGFSQHPCQFTQLLEHADDQDWP